MWYDMDGNTISIEEGAALLQDDRRQIALTVLGEGDDEIRILDCIPCYRSRAR